MFKLPIRQRFAARHLMPVNLKILKGSKKEEQVKQLDALKDVTEKFQLPKSRSTWKSYFPRISEENN